MHRCNSSVSCKHTNVKYCEHCGKVYCVTCSKEWEGASELVHYTPYWVYPYCPTTDTPYCPTTDTPYCDSGSIAGIFTSENDTETGCSH